MPPRRRGAIVWASLGAVVAWPPERAGLARAGPRPTAIPAGAQRSARPSQVTRPATATTRPSRSGALAWSTGAGAAFSVRCRRLSPSWRTRQTDRERACTARPQETGWGWVETRLRSPPQACVSVVPSARRPPREAEGEASIMIQGVHLTASSVRCAPAAGSSSSLALI